MALALPSSIDMWLSNTNASISSSAKSALTQEINTISLVLSNSFMAGPRRRRAKQNNKA